MLSVLVFTIPKPCDNLSQISQLLCLCDRYAFREVQREEDNSQNEITTVVDGYFPCISPLSVLSQELMNFVIFTVTSITKLGITVTTRRKKLYQDVGNACY